MRVEHLAIPDIRVLELSPRAVARVLGSISMRGLPRFPVREVKAKAAIGTSNGSLEATRAWSRQEIIDWALALQQIPALGHKANLKPVLPLGCRTAPRPVPHQGVLGHRPACSVLDPHASLILGMLT